MRRTVDTRAVFIPALLLALFMALFALVSVVFLPRASGQPGHSGGLEAAVESGKLGADVVGALVTTQPNSGDPQDADRPQTVQVIVALADDNTGDGESEAQARLTAEVDSIDGAIGTNSRVTKRWSTLRGFVAEVDLDGLETLAEDATVRRIDLNDDGVVAHVNEMNQNVGLDRVRTELGYTGRNVQVAVLDSGFDTNHPDLADSLIGQRCFAEGGSACPGGFSRAEDVYGHGTWVSGVISSNGSVAGVGGSPDAGIYAIKVLADDGSASSTEYVFDGFDYVISSLPNIDVVNISIGSYALYNGNCDNVDAYTMLWRDGIQTLRSRGVLTTISAGNDANKNAMSSPSCISGAIAVGATYDANVGQASFSSCTDSSTRRDQVSCYSNASPATDIFAPGGRATTSSPGGGTRNVYGTSFSAPLVASCLATMLEANPNLSAQQQEAALENTTDVYVNAGGRTFPRLDCYKAVRSVSGTTPTPQPTPTPPQPTPTQPTPTPPASGEITGTVTLRPEQTQLNVRSGPRLSASVVGGLLNGQVVVLQCWTRGDTVRSFWGVDTTLWHLVTVNGVQGYTSDGYLDTGTNDAPAGEPQCGISPTPTPAPQPTSTPAPQPTPTTAPQPTPTPAPQPTPTPAPQPTPTPAPQPTSTPAPQPTPTPLPQPTPTPPPVDLPTGVVVLYRNQTHLNVRSDASLQATIVGRLDRGEEVVLECWTRGDSVYGYFGRYTDLWHQVTTDGVTGFTSDGYLETGTNGPAPGEPECA